LSVSSGCGCSTPSACSTRSPPPSPRRPPQGFCTAALTGVGGLRRPGTSSPRSSGFSGAAAARPARRHDVPHRKPPAHVQIVVLL
jgi:hypothetical protein